jgi:hypothetical protein
MGDQALLTVLGPTVSVLAGDLEDTSPVIVLKRRVVLCCEFSNHAAVWHLGCSHCQSLPSLPAACCAT